MSSDLTPRQRQVLEFIDAEVRHRGYPPSVREIGEAVGLSSSSTVHAHLAALQDKGYLTRDPTKPRAIEVRLDVESGAPVERRPVRHVPLVGDVAAGTGVLAAENIGKRFGGMVGKEVIPIKEAVAKFRVAVDVRDSLDPDFQIIARCEALTASNSRGLPEAIERMQAYKEAGVTMLSITPVGGDLVKTVETLRELLD